MKIVRVQSPVGPRYASLVDSAAAREPSLAEVRLWSDAPWLGGKPTGEVFRGVASSNLLAPVTPSKIVCVGRNYGAHARELGHDVPSEPLLFLKPPSSLTGPGTVIPLPSMSQRVEHEAELGVVIGRRLKAASASQVLEAIAGITCVNDVTARDIQRREVHFTRAKGFDGFCPVGPHVETELPDLQGLDVIARVNGRVRQHGNTRDMVFSVVDLIAFISQVMTLEPGDLVSTGTPEGVGPLVSGDEVEIEVGGVGVLGNAVGERGTRNAYA
jgi:2-keto-4-pentenoate hydratase/2-oxohepta-3-ene-1,7-dioic acid hydratase in catechol pathway